MKRRETTREPSTTKTRGPAIPLLLLGLMIGLVSAPGTLRATVPVDTSEEIPQAADQLATAGQDPLGNPHFYIETIEVEGLRRASPEILISESLLEPGRDYDESDLRQAVYRVTRLPFVLEARFSLAKGSERGRYRLIIEVDEVARFFFGAEARATAFARDLSLDELEPEDFTDRSDALVGARFFMGQYGSFFTAVTTTGSVQLGLTRYQILGRRVFLSLGLVRQGCCPVTVRPLALDPTFSRWSADENSIRGTLTLGIPLGGNHSLRFEAWRFQTLDGGPYQGSRVQVVGALGNDAVFNLHDDLVDQSVELAWIFDSTDDPTFPTHGLALSVTYQVRELRSDLFTDFETQRDAEGFPVATLLAPPIDLRTQMHRVAATATRHWPLGPRHAVSLGLRLALGRSEIRNVPLGGDRVLEEDDLDLVEGGLSLRHSMALWEAAHHRTPRELRWETTADLGWERTSPSFDLPDNPLERWSLDTALVFRSRWGIFRLGLSFVDVGTAG